MMKLMLVVKLVLYPAPATKFSKKAQSLRWLGLFAFPVLNAVRQGWRWCEGKYVMGCARKGTLGRRWRRGLLVALAIVSGPVLASSEESLCEDGETSYFSCSGRDFVVSVCADKGFPSRKTFIHFRKQGSEDVAIDIPGVRSGLPRATKGQIFSVKGSGAYMRFDAGKTRFVIYSVTGKHGASYGLGRVVEGRLKGKTPCVGNVHADFHGVPLPSGDVFAVSGF